MLLNMLYINFFLVFLATIYLFVTSYFFTNWLRFFRQQHNLSAEDIFLAFIVLIVAVASWPFALFIFFIKQIKRLQVIFIRITIDREF